MQKFLIVLGFFLMLSISANAQSPAEAKPSFDCGKASTKVEKIICNDESGGLKKLDRLYSKLYFSILKSIPKNTKEGQETRKQMQKFAKNFMDYRDNMRCFLLAKNDDKKEVEEVFNKGRENGIMYENHNSVHFGFKPHHYKSCIARVYKMGILLLSTNTIIDTSSLINKDTFYTCEDNMILDIFSIKGLAKFRFYNKLFPQGYEETLTKISQALQVLSSNSRYTQVCAFEDEGFICTNGGCEFDLDEMQTRVVQPLDKFIHNIDLRKLNAN
ncbi:lysozyme inhibitor LprI family protein [Helicobacter sp. MIT 14-3879]|uniref:lysozyme inhibitor LprI family protein n=1 Tax=Helicobacter sp. MIT 14-3879 TaxID=2040649 RepID=UPI000E1F57AB|nr:hypothetical protein [Helicobacter sp. MIT 14-3879]RDU61192.1 hypothetical protein CQA44_09835 [Helicobacter sp. MIT 14-3879]